MIMNTGAHTARVSTHATHYRRYKATISIRRGRAGVFVYKISPAKYCITSQAVKSRSQKSEEETALSISHL